MSVLNGYLNTKGYWSEYQLRLQQSIEAAEMLEDRKQKAVWIHNLGIIAQRTGEYDEARKFYRRSLKIDQELGDMSGIALSLAQLALLEEKMGNLKEALQLILQAEAAFQDLGSSHAKQARKDRERIERNQ
jgi:tetratricopeptide (TPR) repeat protein